MRASDLDLVLAWRNHPEVRRHMHHQQEITPAEHLGWFSHESSNGAIHLLILEVNGVPSGYVKLAELGTGSAEWGFYAAPDASRGTGSILADAALSHAFGKLGVRDVMGHVLASNERSIALHAKMGFVREGCSTTRLDDDTPLSTICFRLVAERWKDLNREDWDDGR